MGYPERLLTDDEQVIRDFHPHWRVLIMPVVWTLLGVIAVVLAWTMIEDNTAASWAVTGVAVVIVATLALPPFLRWLFTQYVLTTERIVVRTGMIAREGTEIPLENINNVLFNQSVLERTLGYGDVLLESAGSQGQSRLQDIPDPEGFQSQVYRIREDRALALESGGSGPRDPAAQIESLAQLHERGALTDDEFAQAKQRLLDEM